MGSFALTVSDALSNRRPCLAQGVRSPFPGCIVIPKSDLISQSGIVFGNPSSGMLLLETINPSNGNRTYLENIVVNTDNQPLSYDAVSESGSNVTSRRKHEYKYVRLNVN